MQMMILGHCKCAHHCFSVNRLPCGVKKLYEGKNECEPEEDGFQLFFLFFFFDRFEPVEDVVYSTSQR